MKNRKIVDEFNTRYSHGFRNGKDRIWDGENFLTLADFRSSTLDQYVWEKKDKVYKSAIWLASSEQNRFKRVIFDPEKEFGLTNNELNLYRGLAYKDKPGNWKLFQLHILNNVCGGDEGYYEYLTQWMASIVQRPWNKDGVAVVIRGGKGTGKSVFAETFGKLFTPYFREVSHAYSLTSHFNADLKECIILNVDEGHWGTNKKGEGVVKNLITQDHLTVEGKGKERIFASNFTHLIFTTNKDWAIPASADERRYLVLDCGTKKQKDRPYFAAIEKQMDNGGYEGMIHDLLATKITLDLSNPPETEGLRDQKLFSEQGVKQWLREWIHDTGDWPQWLCKQTAWEGFSAWCKESRKRENPGKLRFYKEMKKYFPKYREVTPMSMQRKRCIVVPESDVLIKHLDTCNKTIPNLCPFWSIWTKTQSVSSRYYRYLLGKKSPFSGGK